MKGVLLSERDWSGNTGKIFGLGQCLYDSFFISGAGAGDGISQKLHTVIGKCSICIRILLIGGLVIGMKILCCWQLFNGCVGEAVNTFSCFSRNFKEFWRV